MRKFIATLFLFCFFSVLVGCAGGVPEIEPKGDPWEGQVFITEEAAPEGLEYQEIGKIEVQPRGGYGSVEGLYPHLANEARRVGANAVIMTEGGRRLASFSWAAPYTRGTAVKVAEKELLESVDGEYY